MPSRMIRTLGASVILAVLAVAAAIQLDAGEPATAVEIVADAVPTTKSSPAPNDSGVETTQPPSDPFVYRIGLLGAPTTHNFWSYFGSSPTVWDAYVLAPTKGSLFRLDPATQTLVPDLAGGMATPTWDESGWHVVVSLRGDNAWSDGAPVTAGDFEFTFDVVRDLGLSGQWADVFSSAVTDVIAIDDYTIDITFSARPSLDVWPHGVGTAPVMAEHHWRDVAAAAGDARTLFSSTGTGDPASGPVALVSIHPDRIVSRANPGYHGDAADIVEYKIYPGMEAVSGALVAGEIDTMLSPRGLTADEAGALSTSSGMSMVTSPVFGVRFLGFNMNRAPMDAIEFRRAVAFLMDRERLSSEITGAEAARSLLPEASAAWYDPARAEGIAAEGAADPAATFAGLVEALGAVGYSWSSAPSYTDSGVVAGEGLTVDGNEPAVLTILTSGDSHDPSRTAYAARVATAIELLGFDVVPVTTDFDTVIDLTFTPDGGGELRYDMAILGWSLGNPGLPSFYEDLLGSGSPANNSGYSNPEMDRLIALYGTATDVEEARALLWEMEALVARDLPYLPLYASQIVEVYRSDLVAFEVTPGLGGIQGTLGGLESVTPAD